MDGVEIFQIGLRAVFEFVGIFTVFQWFGWYLHWAFSPPADGDE